MKNLIFIFLILCSFQLDAQQKKVLFLGNSYTFFNNMPQLFYEVALSAGDTVHVDSYLSGGARFWTHLNNGTSLEKINSDDWDYVVLQGQSQETALPIEQVEVETFPYAEALCDSIRANNACTRPVFFMTWGRQYGDSYNCPTWPPVCTYEGMDSLLRMRYLMLGEMNEAYVSPVGAVWRYLRETRPDINLYHPDQSHPSPAGSFVAACTFYTLIFQKDPTLINYGYLLGITDLIDVKNAVKLIVYDQLDTWYVGAYDPQAAFDYNSTGTTVNFNNASLYGDDFLWDFGSGNVSTLENPSHDFISDGNYPVQLITSSCGLSDTLEINVNTEAVSNNYLAKTPYKLYPNPVIDQLEITGMSVGEIVVFYDLRGRECKRITANNVSLHLILDGWNSGIYFIKIETKDGQLRYMDKVLIKD